MSSVPAEPVSTHDGVQADAAVQFEDFKVLGGIESINKNELFDDQFLEFMKWFRRDVHSTYSKADFRRIERNNFIAYSVGFAALVAAYAALWLLALDWAWVWGPLLLLPALAVAKKGELVHMRAHSPINMTGVPWMDRAVDLLGLASMGVSTNLFKRRHLAAHYNDIGGTARLFSKAWLTFDRVPASYYLRPFMLVKFMLDRDFCEREKINRKLLVIESAIFYAWFAALVYETFFTRSFFLLTYQLVPALAVVSSQIMGAALVHSGTDARNSFNSNGLFDPKTAKGLWRVSMGWFGLFNNGMFVNHGIHHAYPQVPLNIINENYERYNAHILATWKNVRYNTLINGETHANILGRLPPAGPLAHVVQVLVAALTHVAMCFVVMGIPIPPNFFELPLLDWRAMVRSTRRERLENWVKFIERIELPQRYPTMQNPNTYARFFYWRYLRAKAKLGQALPTPDDVVAAK